MKEVTMHITYHSRLSACIAATALTVSLAACSSSIPEASDKESTPAQQTTEQKATEPAQPAIEPSEITILSSGDVLPHQPVLNAAKTADGYDFTPMYSEIKQWISGADLALCSMEVPLIRADQQPSSYPIFGSPPQVAAMLKEVGFDGCMTASNHAMDRGFDGLVSTIDALQEHGLGFAGTARTDEEANEIMFYTLQSGGRSVKIAQIAATTVTNGFSNPPEHPYAWNIVGDEGKPIDTVINSAQRARELGADLVVAHIHWGAEYNHDPAPEQTEIAQKLADSGQIDLVIGGHPHVIQPIRKLDGGPDGSGMWVIYSMGNQLSNQNEVDTGTASTMGYMATTTVSVPVEGAARVKNVEWTMTSVDRSSGYKIFPFFDVLDGSIPEWSSITPQIVHNREQAAYPTMVESGSERTTPPTPVATSLTQSRES